MTAPRFRLGLLLVTLLGLALVAAPAAQAATVDAVAASLRTDPVYNDPAAENTLTAGQADDLRDQIAATGLPIFIAVLPGSMATAAGGPDALLRDLRNTVGRNGVYAVIAGNAFRAGSTSGSVTSIADEAFAAQASAGPYAVLEAFVAGVDTYDNSGSGGSSSSSSSSGGSGLGTFILLLILALIAGVVIFFLVRRSRRSKARELAQMRAVLDEDVTSLGERLGSFDLTDPRLDDAGRADLQKALDSYSRASDAAARATSDGDITRATSELQEGRYALACVEARMDGRELPQHRPPCFFDPRHGPSVTDVMWASPGAPAHPVPACAQCAGALQAGAVPQAREVEYAGRRVPYYDAGPAYAPYARGYFDSFGQMLPAMFMGTLLASAFMPAATGVSTAGIGGMPMGDGGGSSGGFGGGDFGGGGFGGGDFGGGGGDFGGGDFGG